VLVSKFWYVERPDASTTPLNAIPSPRYRHSSAVINKSMFVFGGISKSQQKYNDLYEYRILYSNWRQIRTELSSAPSPRTFHKACSKKNCEDGSLYLFGGSSDHKLKDLYKILDKSFWDSYQQPPMKIEYSEFKANTISDYNRSDSMALSSDINVSLSYLEDRSMTISKFGNKDDD